MNIIKRYAWCFAFGAVISFAGWTDPLSWKLWAAVIPMAFMVEWARMPDR